VIAAMCERAVSAVRAGRTLFFCGNGGSFTDAQHIVGELVGRYMYDRPGIAAVTLGSNFASLTAVGNDYGYEDIFVREVDALVRPGDVVFGLSTSGGSANVLKALRRAKAIGAHTVGWTGSKTKTAMDEVCEIVLHVPSGLTPRIQESHILVGHILAGALETALHPKG
jgi:D-sedoheptulose 7-phosphate isomerase